MNATFMTEISIRIINVSIMVLKSRHVVGGHTHGRPHTREMVLIVFMATLK